MKKKEELLIATAMFGAFTGIVTAQSSVFAEDVNNSQILENSDTSEIIKDIENNEENSDNEANNTLELNDKQNTFSELEKDNTDEFVESKEDKEEKFEIYEEPVVPEELEEKNKNNILDVGNNKEYSDNTEELHDLETSPYISYTVTRNGIQTTLQGIVLKNGQAYDSAVNADFIILEASAGYSGTNSYFDQTAQQILDSGKLLAMMHEARKGIKEDGHMEAFHFYQVIKSYVGKGLPILKFDNLDMDAGPVWADEFMDTLYGLSGMRGIIWTSNEVLNKGDWEEIQKEQQIITNATTMNISKEQWNEKCKLTLPNGITEMYRMYNPYSGEHLYTKNGKERDDLVKIGWRYESIGWSAPQKGLEVYRLYNPYSGDHLYTTKSKERDDLVKIGWRYEGIGFYSEKKETTPVYRLFNPFTLIGTHHFTTNKSEYDDLQKYGWRGEGIGWYGALSSVPRNVVPNGNYIKQQKAYNQNKMKLTGIQKVNNVFYYFNPNNNGKYNKGTGITTVAGTNKKVYVTEDGSLSVGWKMIDNMYKWFDPDTAVLSVNYKDSKNLLCGIDISNWQRVIDLNAVDIDFAILKATGGTGFLDPSFNRFANETLSGGRLLGFYHFARDNGYKGSAKDEANFFYSNVKDYIGKGIPILDWETDLNLGVSWVKEFLDTFYSLSGVKPLIYTSAYVTRQYDWSPISQNGYKLWLAQYASINPVNGHQTEVWVDGKGVGSFGNYVMHQYTSNGRLNGYNGALDLDLFYGTALDWKKLCEKS